MGPRELVLNPEVSAWRHPDGAVKANRLPPRATTASAPDCCSPEPLARELRRAGRGASRRTVGGSGADRRIDVQLLRGLEIGRAGLGMDAINGTDLDAGIVLD